MIRPFKKEDMAYVLNNGIKEYGMCSFSDENLEKLATRREENGQCITGVVNDVIVGVGGIDIMWEGVGEVWIMLTNEVNKVPFSAYQVIKDGLQKLIDDNNLFRVQAWGRVGFDKAHTLFRHLGFTPEGVAKKYTPDKVDCILYSKVKDD